MNLPQVKNFSLRFSDLMMLLVVLAALLLTPGVVYLLQQDAAENLIATKNRLSEHRELMNDMRREAVIISSGLRDNSARIMLDYVSRYNTNTALLDRELKQHPQLLEQAHSQWQNYQKNHKAFLLLIQKVSSLSSSLQNQLRQSQIQYQQAGRRLAQLPLSEPARQRYQLALSELLNLSLRFATFPDSESALQLQTALDQIRVDLQILDSPGLKTLMQESVSWHQQLRQTVADTYAALNELTYLPVYYSFDQFYQQYEQLLVRHYRSSAAQVRNLIYALAVMFLLTVVFSLHLRRWKRRLEVLNAELEGFKNALDEHAIVSMTDRRGVITYVNKKFVEISGFPETELLGQTHRIVNSGLHPKAFFRELWRSVAENRIWHGDVCNTTKAGEHYWVRATVVPIYNRKNQLDAIISVRTDITLQKQVEQALVREKEKAEEASEAKSRFLANMSHEIRTPMNAVIGLSHLALQHSKEDKTKNFLFKIQGAANNLLGIINDILDFSKIEAGKLDIESTPYRLDNVLNNLLSVAEVKASEKGLPIHVEVAPDVPNFLLGDPLRLGQVLLNLTNNAIKFSEKGEIRLQVDLIHSSDTRAELRFAVKDSGIGISEKAQQRLFEAFNQADVSTTRQYGGTGLGLTICKQLVELMGGQIGVFSKEGEGSEFFFSICNQIEHPAQHRHTDLQSLRVLCVDDEEIALASVTRQLNAVGINVTGESNAPQALNRLVNAGALGEDEFDVLLVDWDMPMLSGLDIAQSVRNNPNLKKQPVIILITAHCSEPLHDQLNHHLVDNVLLKPVTGSHLIDCIQDSLQLRHQKYPPVTDAAESQSVLHSLPGRRPEDRLAACAGARVLVAEDNGINQEVILGLLEQYSLDITLVDDGEKAVRAVQGQHFDLILMDIQMPHLDGLEASRQILQMYGKKTPPIVAMTAHAQQEDIRECLELGMSDHIGKPIDPAQLEQVILRWIQPRAVLTEDLPSVVSAIPASPESVPETALSQSLLQTLSQTLPTEVFDLQQGLRSSSADEALLQRLLLRFAEDYRTGNEPAQHWLHNNDTPALQHWLHTLKGSASTLGFGRLADCAGALELAVNNHTLLKAEQLAQLQENLTAITSVLTQAPSEPSAASVPTPHNGDAAPDAPLADKDQIGPLIEHLLLLLDEGDADALDLCADLSARVAGHPRASAQAAEIEALAEGFDFEQASQRAVQFRQQFLD